MAATLEQIREGEVPAELAGTYRDIKQALRISYVPLFFRALAPVPGALKAVWRQLKPNVATRAFEEEADDLRGELVKAAVELGAPLIETELAAAGFDVDEIDELRQHVLLFQYADPKLLLCVTAIREALEGHPVGGARLPEEMLSALPDVPADELPNLELVPENPGGIVGEVFREILATTHLPAATVDLRALGHWPAALEVAWEEIGPLYTKRGFQPALERIVRSAESRLTRLPFALDIGPGTFGHASEQAHVARLVSLFADALPRLAFFTTALRVSLDGPQDALDSPYPVDWEQTTVEPLGL